MTTPNMKSRGIFLLLCLAAMPGLAWSWWNDDWSSRKQITLDASMTGADLRDSVADFPVLVRLHTGNFSYFSELAEGGKDIRFMADDKTPLKFHVEKFDALNEMALVWVKMPSIQGGASSDAFWMYYGNGGAQSGEDNGGTYDVSQALVFHFDEKNPVPKDATAYGNHAARSMAAVEPAGWIGAAAKFAAAGAIEVNPSPSLQLDPAKGWTFSAWIKIDQGQPEATIFRAAEGDNALELLVRDATVVARYAKDGKPVETSPAPVQQPGQWRHVAVTLRADKLELYVDGNRAGEVPVAPAAMNPSLTLGGSASGGFLAGFLDEVQISNTARAADWIKLSARSQSLDFTVVNLGQDEGKQGAGGTNSFAVIIQNVTIDGWVVIALTGVMFVVAMIVMVVKAIVISKIRKDNKAFMAQYEALSPGDDPAKLDQEESEEEKELADSEFLSALVGKHDHYQSSPLYHIYHAGIREVKKRVEGTNRPLTQEALHVIRVKLDSIVVQESQRLNGKMVLLTIAIAGGPFLGLLGTVVGVMITFAVIAATGDVNINSIAPGIAAALLATVAGLAVAIPSLFAYNYLLVQIKDLIADMRVFSDEFLAMLSENVADRFRGA
jgi:biopolymer transport protein ExbB